MKSRSCRTTRRKSCAYTKFSLDDPFRPLTRRNALPNPRICLRTAEVRYVACVTDDDCGLGWQRVAGLRCTLNEQFVSDEILRCEPPTKKPQQVPARTATDFEQPDSCEIVDARSLEQIQSDSVDLLHPEEHLIPVDGVAVLWEVVLTVEVALPDAAEFGIVDVGKVIVRHQISACEG